MNLIILQTGDFITPTRALLSGRRHRHIDSILKVKVNDSLRVGVLNGQIGIAKVLKHSKLTTELEVKLSQPSPLPLPLTLILALPRPKVLKRVIQHVVALGVKQLHLIHTYRVEKSYWQSPWLAENKLREQCLLGLEQAVDTQMPEITLHKRFKPFVEDKLPETCRNTLKLIAHPYASTPCPVNLTQPTTLAVGPEGGFITYEIEKLQQAGFAEAHLGPRILRVETALPALLGRLFPGR